MSKRRFKPYGKPTTRFYDPDQPGLIEEPKPEDCVIIETDGPLTIEFKNEPVERER